MASSSDCLKVYTADYESMYASSDGGTTWSKMELQPYALYSYNIVISSSSDGSKLAISAVDPNTSQIVIFISGDGGASWNKTLSLPIAQIYAIASSADGTNIFHLRSGSSGNVLQSTDGGQTWTNTL